MELPSFLTESSTRVRATAGLIVGALLLYFAVPAIFPHNAPKGQLLNGAEFGAVNGLLAMGLVLIYRATKVINFSYGAMAALSATVAAELNLGPPHLNWFLCIAIALACGAALGLLVDVVIRWRFFNAPASS